MRRYMTEYLRYLSEILEHPDTHDISALRQEVLVQIGFMQHERLIHFLVTMLFALLFMLSVGILFFVRSLAMLLLTILLLALLIPYVAYYYFLENTVQKFYVLYNRIAALDDNSAYPNTDVDKKR